MQKRFLPIFLGIIIISILITQVNCVKATNYEWIQNPSFEAGDGSEYVTGGDMELGISAYGWTNVGVTWSTTYYKSATHSALISSGDALYYNFSEPIPVGAIQSIEFYACAVIAAQGGNFRIYYDDGTYEAGTYDAIDNDGNFNSSSYVNPLNGTRMTGGTPLVLEEGRYVTMLFWNYWTGTAQYIDNVSVKSSEVGQSQITTNSEPWYSENENLGVNGDISSLLSHSGNHSLRLHYGIIALGVSQRINYLNVDNIQDFSCWVRFTVSGIKTFYITAYYSDGTYQQVRKDLASFAQWTKVDLTGCLVDGKNVIRITISIISGMSTGDIYIDDVSLIANLPYGQASFELDFFPAVTIDNMGTYWLSVNQQYIARGSLYDNAGLLTENGTYSIISSKGFFNNGSMILGVFQFNMPQRDFYENEIFTITVYVYNASIIQRTIILIVNIQWFSGDYGNVSPTPSNSQIPDIPYLDDATIRNNVMFIVLFILVFVPPMILSLIFWSKDQNPLIGFIGGLVLTSAIAYMSSLVQVWFLFLVVIVLVMSVVAMLKGVGGRNNG